MKIMTGDAAVRASVPGTHILDTADGIILFPDAGTNGSTGAGTGDRSGAITCTRAVRYRPGYAGHLPEFWPADAAEACRMARSAKLYAGTYRTNMTAADFTNTDPNFTNETGLSGYMRKYGEKGTWKCYRVSEVKTM